MQKKFNLLVSTPRFHERDAAAEIWYLFSNVGDEEVKTKRTPFPGLITAKLSLDPIESIRKLRSLIEEDPLLLRYVLKIVPIETIIDTTLENITKLASEFSNRILEEESFRITVKGRQSPLDSQELIIEVGEFIDRKVNLSAPDKIVMIQILGDLTGMSLLQPEDILSKVEFEL